MRIASISLVLALSPGLAIITSSRIGRADPVTLPATFVVDHDTFLDISDLIISPGTKVFIKSSAALTILADHGVTLGDNLEFIADGDNNMPTRSDRPPARGEWTSSGGGCSPWKNCPNSAHWRWQDALNSCYRTPPATASDIGLSGYKGNTGQAGGKIRLIFHTIATSSRPFKILSAKGGDGGGGGPAGIGKLLICSQHNERVNCPDGPSGPRGDVGQEGLIEIVVNGPVAGAVLSNALTVSGKVQGKELNDADFAKRVAEERGKPHPSNLFAL